MVRPRPHKQAPDDTPQRRRLRTFAFDPMTSRLSGRILTLDVPYEPLQPGPVGRQLAVVDYDPVRKVWYQPVNLDAGAVLAQDGLAPSEADPRCHQQIVYAVGASVIERVERFMGRPLRFKGSRQLRMVPHAFEGRNAYFHPDKGVLFGYYMAERRDPGPNLPGQTIFSCLSNDVIAHELTHAIVHRLRQFYIEPTNPDLFAIHEGMADLVALFHHFVDHSVVYDAIASSEGKIELATGLFDLASEFGYSTGRGAALRAYLRDARPDDDATRHQHLDAREPLATDVDPHQRGANFVMAVFDAFLDSYRAAIADLLRIATGGTGVLPPGRLHPDLVSRLTDEAIKYADRLLGMVIRSFDYLPVLDATFSDVVRSIVTADHDLYPDDQGRLRARLVESFRRRAIFPEVRALTDEALVWPSPSIALTLAEGDAERVLADVIRAETTGLDPTLRTLAAEDPAAADPLEELEELPEPAEGQQPEGAVLGQSVAEAFSGWAERHAEALGLDPSITIRVRGIHVSYRQAADRRPRPEVVLQFHQTHPAADPSALPMRSGTTVIARANGAVRYVVSKPLVVPPPAAGSEPVTEYAWSAAGRERYEAITAWIASLDDSDAASLWAKKPAYARQNFASLHEDD